MYRGYELHRPPYIDSTVDVYNGKVQIIRPEKEV
jgi:hypothetical protein